MPKEIDKTLQYKNADESHKWEKWPFSDHNDETKWAATCKKCGATKLVGLVCPYRCIN